MTPTGNTYVTVIANDLFYIGVSNLIEIEYFQRRPGVIDIRAKTIRFSKKLLRLRGYVPI